MPSFVWDRDPSEAYANPYEYEAQEQFAREAGAFLKDVFTQLMESARSWYRDDRSVEKAVWMLQVDALDALRDCLQLLGEKRHRLVGRLFRDILENLNLAAYFDSGKETAATDLDSWYDNEIVPHSRYRDYVEKNEGHDKAAESRASYRRLSKFTHRTYRSLAQGYVLASENRIVYEGVSESGLLIPPHTISQVLRGCGPAHHGTGCAP